MKSLYKSLYLNKQHNSIRELFLQSGGPLLTQEQVGSLPEGVLVEVIWSGGNGPHTYRLSRQEGYPAAMACVLGRAILPLAALDFVGQESYHTWVRIDEDPTDEVI